MVFYRLSAKNRLVIPSDVLSSQRHPSSHQLCKTCDIPCPIIFPLCLYLHFPGFSASAHKICKLSLSRLYKSFNTYHPTPPKSFTNYRINDARTVENAEILKALESIKSKQEQLAEANNGAYDPRMSTLRAWEEDVKIGLQNIERRLVA